jgi:hypothetical protein
LYVAKFSVTWKEIFSSYHLNHIELSEVKEGSFEKNEKKNEEKINKENINFFLNDSDIICWKHTQEDPENKDHFMRKIKSSATFLFYDNGSSSQKKEGSLKIDLIYK